MLDKNIFLLKCIQLLNLSGLFTFTVPEAGLEFKVLKSKTTVLFPTVQSELEN